MRPLQWAAHIKRRTDDLWGNRVMEWSPRLGTTRLSRCAEWRHLQKTLATVETEEVNNEYSRVPLERFILSREQESTNYDDDDRVVHDWLFCRQTVMADSLVLDSGLEPLHCQLFCCKVEWFSVLIVCYQLFRCRVEYFSVLIVHTYLSLNKYHFYLNLMVLIENSC